MIQKKTLTARGGGRETHAIITVDDSSLSFKEQLESVRHQYHVLRDEEGERMRPMFKRWFLSDSANQASLLPDCDCAVSVVEQAPLNLTKIALWVWLIEDALPERQPDGSFAMIHGGYMHLLEGGCCRPGIGPYAATYDMLSSAELRLRGLGGSLLENCVRTWLFVQNVDVNYAGVVNGRNSAFEEFGLTPSTRFIASTGIGGRHADKSVAVQMDSYSVKGLSEGQMKQINAPEYLNPTCEYGVAFERATSIDYGDRRHLFISGTASIDNRGQVVWEGDIRRQTERMWTNVGALLGEADCNWQDVGQILVYLRDPADYGVVSRMFEERFPDTPYVILLAPVCRPGWLIEMECMAMKPIESEYADF